MSASHSSAYRIVSALQDRTYIFDDDGFTAANPGAKVVSKIDGGDAADGLFTLELQKLVFDEETGLSTFKKTDVIDTSDMYRYYATPVQGNMGDSITFSFYVSSTKDISCYQFEMDQVVSIPANKTVSLTDIKAKGYRDGSTAAKLDSSSYVLGEEGNGGPWFTAEYIEEDDEWCRGTSLGTAAPSTPGLYCVIVKGNSANKYTGTNKIFFELTNNNIATPPTAVSGLTYNGSYQHGLTGGAGYTVVSGSTTSAVNAGSYSASVVPSSGYVWPDGTATAKTIPWTIAPAKIAIPTAVTGLKYTGSVQYGVTAASGVTLSGTCYATNVGTYYAYAALPNTSTTHNYQWSDYTTGTKTISWSIAKGSLPVSMTNSKDTVFTGTTYDVGYSYAGDGPITAASSNTAVATVAVSASKAVTVTPKAAGVAVITVSAAGTSNCNAASNTIVITVKKPEAAPSGSFINADGSFAGGSNGGVPGSASDAQQAAASYKVTTPSGSSTPTVTYLGGATSGRVTIASTVKDQNGVTYRVTAIAKGALKGTKITKASLGSYVKTIGSSAFSGCSKLTSLTIGKNVTSIGTSAIKGCTKLKAVTVKSSKLTKLGIRNLVKGTKVTTIKCSGLSKQVIDKYAKWAKYYNKKVTVK